MTSFRAAFFAALCSIFLASCGDTFRPIAIPAPGTLPTPQASKTAQVITGTAAGTVTNYNLSGNTITGQATLGQGPSAALLFGSRVYVANKSDNTLSVYSATSPQNPVPGTITLTPNSAPQALASVPNFPVLYVAYPTLNKIGIVSSATNTETGSISLNANGFTGSGPAVMMADHEGRKLFVGNAGSDNISIIDPITNAVVATVGSGVCGDPIAMASTPDADFVYVACHATNNVLILDAIANTVDFNIPVGVAPSSLALDVKNKRLIVTNEGDNTLSLLAEDFSKPSAEQHVVTTVPIGAVPVGAAPLPDGTRVYVATTAGNVVVIDSVTLALKSTIGMGGQPFAIAASSDSLRVAVATSTPELKAIDTTTDTVAATFSLAGPPKAMILF
jgi:YVTN family beta-propeller protein